VRITKRKAMQEAENEHGDRIRELRERAQHVSLLWLDTSSFG
jgi:hypothetical protein